MRFCRGSAISTTTTIAPDNLVNFYFRSLKKLISCHEIRIL